MKPRTRTLPGRQALGYSLSAGAAVLWASQVVLGKLLVISGVDTVPVVAIRATIAATTLAVVLWLRGGICAISSARDFRLFVLDGAAVAGSAASLLQSLKHSSTVMAVALACTYPAFVMIIARFTLGEPIDRRGLYALVLTLGGAALVSGVLIPGALRITPLGFVFGAATSIATAVDTVVGKSLSRSYGPWVASMYGFGFAACFLWLGKGPHQIVQAASHWPVTIWIPVVSLALFSTLLGSGFYMWSLTIIKAAHAAMIGTLEPVLATAFAWLFWGEPVTFWHVVGGALVLAGMGILVGG